MREDSPLIAAQRGERGRVVSFGFDDLVVLCQAVRVEGCAKFVRRAKVRVPEQRGTNSKLLCGSVCCVAVCGSLEARLGAAVEGCR